MKGFTIYDLLRRSSCVRIMMLLALFTFNCSLFISEAQAQDAFYIYQNDGHFDGFFYDDIQKISYSFLDTLGIEHDEIVSQEIVTADSTYRIMLSAIDSVGFVQPEVKTNPRLRVYDKFYTYDKSINKDWEFWIQCVPNIEELLGHTIDNPFFRFPNLPGFLSDDMIPQIGDVLVSYGGYYGDDPQKGWSYKVYKIEVDPEQPNVSIAYLKPIDDITDIFQQFVSVEEYGYNEEGNMTRRRVAGRPDLTVGKFPKKAKGQWEGDLFNFALNAHIPLYDENDLTISIDPSIEGKLNIKTAWNFSLLGDKYIGITTKLTSGVSVSFSVDGKIKDFFPGGIGGLFGGVPIPATCPIVMLDIAPDAFLRGEAHVNFKMTSPKIQTAMWSKLEIKNWIPSMDIGFNNSDGGNADVGIDTGSAGVTMSLNGFIQAGMLFPMTFKSLPLIKKLFDSEIGGKWFLGPKLAADFTLDLTTAPWEDVAAYNQMKNVTASVHMLDADYEVKGTIKTAFSGKKEVTLADGSISLFPPLDAKLVPEFDDCEDYFEDGGQDVEGYTIKRRVLAFKPNGAVIMPVKIGTIRTRMPATTYDFISTEYAAPTSYYHIHQMMGQEVPKSQWARFVLSYPQDHYLMFSQEYTIWPCVSFTGQYPYYKATPEYKFVYGMRAKIEGDTVLLNHDGTMVSTVRIIPLEGEITPPKVRGRKLSMAGCKTNRGRRQRDYR